MWRPTLSASRSRRWPTPRGGRSWRGLRGGRRPSRSFEAVRDERACRLEASAGARARRADSARAGGSVAAVHARRGAARGGRRVRPGVPPLLGCAATTGWTSTSNGCKQKEIDDDDGRQVGETTSPRPPDTEIEVTRVFDAPSGAGLRRLDEARAHPELDARPARLDDAGVRGRSPSGRRLALCLAALPTATRWTCRASTARSSPPERLVSTESWGGEWPETVNTVDLQRGGRSNDRRHHRRSYPSKEARDAALGTGMKHGMTLSFDRLAAYLA